MSLERDAEHVVALALEPVSSLPDVPHTRHRKRLATRDRCLYAKKPAIRERAKKEYGIDLS